jgi:hypothetical protein
MQILALQKAADRRKDQQAVKEESFRAADSSRSLFHTAFLCLPFEFASKFSPNFATVSFRSF